jgi:hypothetical protein
MLLLASMEGLHDAEGPVGLERHGGDPGVESPATIGARRGDTILAAAERVAEARGGGADDGRVEEAPVVLLHLHGIGAVRAVHGGRHVRRQREAQPAAADRRVAPAGAAAAEVLAAVAGHFGETGRAAGREEDDEEVVGRRDDERSIIGEYMPQ